VEKFLFWVQFRWTPPLTSCIISLYLLYTSVSSQVVQQVCSVALIKIHLQFTIAKEHAGRKVRPQPDPHFETVMGLPSATTIYDLRAANQSLPMSAVHKQWWLALDLQVGTPAIQIFEHVVARVRGCPSIAVVATRATSRQPISSTRREPNAFETIGRAPRLCKECRRPGHDVRNCPVLRPLMGGNQKGGDRGGEN
jgi:hypothetical protein